MNQKRHIDEPSSLLKASLAELEHQRASVLALNQLKNDLIAVLAHDIKGPLTSIIGFAELLEEGYLEGGDAVDAARTIRANAQRLATLANDVLALSRIEHGELEIADEQVDLVALLTQLIESLKGAAEIRFASELPQAVVRGDTERLHQAFENLLRNAIKYSSEKAPIEVALKRSGENFSIDVRDRGIGIPAEDMPKLFARFSRGSNARRAKIAGTGLGLFIVKMIVERHGGSVGVKSTLGDGSTFTVVLPSVEAEFARKPMRVTIVAVDPHIRLFVAYELRSRAYRVRECESIAAVPALGDLRDGDVVVLGPNAGTPAELRAVLPAEIRVRLVGIEKNETECDAVLRQPFLAGDLLAAVSGEAGGTLLNTDAGTSDVPKDERLADSARIP